MTRATLTGHPRGRQIKVEIGTVVRVVHGDESEVALSSAQLEVDVLHADGGLPIVDALRSESDEHLSCDLERHSVAGRGIHRQSERDIVGAEQ